MPSRQRRERATGGQEEDEATEGDDRDCLDIWRVRAMEMTNRNMCPNSKPDERNCDGPLKHNGGDTEITVPLSCAVIGKKKVSPMEGTISLHNFNNRKHLVVVKRSLCTWALATAVLGITLMILHNEMCPAIYLPVSESNCRTQ